MRASAVLLVSALIFVTEAQESVNVVGEAVIEHAPNYARLEIGAKSTRETSDSALADVQGSMSRLLQLARHFHIDSSKMSVQRIVVEPVEAFDREKGTAQVFGYSAQMTYRIEVGKIGDVEPFVNSCLDSGINFLSSLTYLHSKRDSLQRAAYVAALQDAEASAKALCAHSGRKLGKLLKVSYEKPDGFHVQMWERRDRRWNHDNISRGGGGTPRPTVPLIPAPIKVTAKLFALYEMK